MANSTIRVTETVASTDSLPKGTGWLLLRGEHEFFDISVVPDGSFSGTVFLQRKRPGEPDSAARDVESYTGAVEKISEVAGPWDVRLWVKSGGVTAGEAALELGS